MSDRYDLAACAAHTRADRDLGCHDYAAISAFLLRVDETTPTLADYWRDRDARRELRRLNDRAADLDLHLGVFEIMAREQLARIPIESRLFPRDAALTASGAP